MSLFRRKKKSDEDDAAVAGADTVEAPAVEASSDPDPSGWAIPPDAPAPSGEPLDDTPPPELMDAPTGEPLDDTPPPELAPVGEPLDETPPPELAAPAPEPVAAATPTPAPRPEPPRRPLPAPEPARNLPSTSTFGDLARDRPELIVAGAFVGAFLVARILKRIGSD